MRRDKIHLVLSLVFVVTLFSNGLVYSKTHSIIDPIVSSDWLEANGDMNGLVIIDIRTALEYDANHIENSINVPFEVPFSAWITMKDGILLLELPEDDDLFNTIGSCGITEDSAVVIVTSTPAPNEPLPYSIANATRVAWTLAYAGIENVAILDGGYGHWVAQGKPTTTIVPQVVPVAYEGTINKKVVTFIDDVVEHIGKPVILDARDYEVYTGQVIEPYAPVPGHIESAKSLPTPLMWDADWTYKDIDTLAQMAYDVIGEDDNKEIVVYCGVGGYASTVWFVLAQVLDYKDVCVYDGSAQEWVLYYDMVLD